jgi:RNA polymerase sigma-70 factor (ECF subfamily)
VTDTTAVALAFIALLQRLPPKQRAALLLKDVVGWSAEEIAAVLDLSAPAVNSALHRARETMATHVRTPADEPSPEVLAAYVRSWETRDLDGLVALLREDVIFAMPPHSIWLRGRDAVRGLLLSPRFSAFWARGLRATHTRASGLPALAWYWGGHEDGVLRLHSIHVMRFEGGRSQRRSTSSGHITCAGSASLRPSANPSDQTVESAVRGRRG